MNFNRFENLCELARTESSPQPEVNAEVMAWVQDESMATLQWVQRPMWWCAGVAATAAMIALACAVFQAHSGTDPLLEVTETIDWVLQ